MVADSTAVLAAGHRIALMRNLSSRLGLDYRGDLDKTPDGRFINGAGYTLRVGFCVDALLAIDPEQFRGCDLILDEVVQVVRHLLTSLTCAKDGKRPAILARLRALIQVARRVIIADADLDNATIRYIQDLRGENAPVYLIRNDCQPESYQVLMIDIPDRSVILKRILEALAVLPLGKVLFIATDSKATSKVVARLIEQELPDKRLLLVNSDTSGGDKEQEFVLYPDRVLVRNEYDVVICSPSVGTGVSIECQDIIQGVYGIFMGVSSTDADMAQALGRVRQPIRPGGDGVLSGAVTFLKSVARLTH
ncbi:hypothetical protein HC928_11750 [bacterium]|nr:hypothetical protein [bacterium]